MDDIKADQTDLDTLVPPAPAKKKRPKLKVPDSERWAFSIDEAAAKAGFSRALLWGFAQEGIIKVRRFRGRTWITADDLREFLRNPPATP